MKELLEGGSTRDSCKKEERNEQPSFQFLIGALIHLDDRRAAAYSSDAAITVRRHASSFRLSLGGEGGGFRRSSYYTATIPIFTLWIIDGVKTRGVAAIHKLVNMFSPFLPEERRK